MEYYRHIHEWLLNMKSFDKRSMHPRTQQKSHLWVSSLCVLDQLPLDREMRWRNRKDHQYYKSMMGLLSRHNL